MRRWTPKVLDRLILLIATLILAARQYGWPSVGFWSMQLADREYIVVILIAVIGVFGTLTPIDAVAHRGRGDRREALERQILARFGTILSIGQKVSPRLGLDDVGLHVWAIRRRARHLFRARLTRAATYRLGSTPATRQFDPSRGVGVVGLCWKWNREVSVDVAELAAMLTSQQKYDTFAQQRGEDAVMGLPWSDFERLRHRGAVFASPIRNARGRFVGCVSVDASRGYATIDGQPLWREINSLCDLIRQDGFRFL